MVKIHVLRMHSLLRKQQSGTARHEFMTAKMERLEGLRVELVELVGEEEAITIIADTIWTPQDQRGAQSQKELHP
jgi:hypothetical protein